VVAILIGCVGQKGGIGKSSCSRLIAREYAQAGWTVKIADLDTAQGSSVDWKKRRDQNGIQPEVAVESFRTVGQALKVAPSYDLMIFDTPPHSSTGTKEIARAADLVILPTGLSLDDLRPSVLLAHELKDAGIPVDRLVFVLWRVGDRENEINEARQYIGQAGYLVLPGSIPERTAYRRASDEGRALSEVRHQSLRLRSEEVAQGVIDRLTEHSRKIHAS
jgi:chromosome partitioning protein